MKYVFIIFIIISILMIIIPLLYYNITGKSLWYNWLILSIGIIILFNAILLYVYYDIMYAGIDSAEKSAQYVGPALQVAALLA